MTPMKAVIVLLVSAGFLTVGALAQSPNKGQGAASEAEVAKMRAAIAACFARHWRLPRKGRPVIVRVRWHLEKDGRLAGPPELVAPQMTPQFRPSVEGAIAAVRGCQPFKLPAEHYDLWKTITWEFDPFPR
jgi:hypothetical protein